MVRVESLGVQNELTDSVSRMVWKIIDDYKNREDTNKNKIDISVGNIKDLVIVSILGTKYRVAFKSMHRPDVRITYLNNTNTEYMMLDTEYSRMTQGGQNVNICNE